MATMNAYVVLFVLAMSLTIDVASTGTKSKCSVRLFD